MSLREKEIQQLRNDGYDDLAEYILDLEWIVLSVAHIGHDMGGVPFDLGLADIQKAQEVLSSGTDIVLGESKQLGEVKG